MESQQMSDTNKYNKKFRILWLKLFGPEMSAVTAAAMFAMSNRFKPASTGR